MHGMTPISKKRAQNGHGASSLDDSRNGFHLNGGLGENEERECPSCGISSAFIIFQKYSNLFYKNFSS